LHGQGNTLPMHFHMLRYVSMNVLQTLPTISTTELQKHMGDTFKRVAFGEHIRVESNGFPIAILVPIADYQGKFQIDGQTPSDE
jgi:prevent-host-death family protein